MYCKAGTEGGVQKLWEDLDASFLDSQEQKEAAQKLTYFKQGSLTAEEFFQQFENLRLRAGYEGEQYNSHLINLLEKGFNWEATKIISVQPEPPETYEDWKTRAIKVDNLLKQHNRSNPTRPPPPHTPYRYPAVTGYTRQSTTASSSSSLPTTKATTFGGHGQPMDIDRSKGKPGCYRCGE